jgi:hypothetical protein
MITTNYSCRILWLVFYLLAGGLTIAPFGTANAGH